MKLYNFPIEKVVFKNKKVKIDTTFQTVLKCYDIFNDDILSYYDKIDMALSLLIKSHVLLHVISSKDKVELFQEVFKQFLNIPGKKTLSSQKLFDFEQDSELIYSSFLQCYNMDLRRKNMKLHWWNFISLFNGLSEDTKMMQVISIRARPLPKPTKYNIEERQNLMRLKSLYRLEISEEERKAQFQEGLAKMALSLTKIAKKGEGTN